jgi:hypothetical protein
MKLTWMTSINEVASAAAPHHLPLRYSHFPLPSHSLLPLNQFQTLTHHRLPQEAARLSAVEVGDGHNHCKHSHQTHNHPSKRAHRSHQKKRKIYPLNTILEKCLPVLGSTRRRLVRFLGCWLCQTIWWRRREGVRVQVGAGVWLVGRVRCRDGDRGRGRGVARML